MKETLIKKAQEIRLQVLEMIYRAGKGHIGGAFSCLDILVSLFYGGILKFDPQKPLWEGRDRFILSKGHSAAALYAVLADLGFFPGEHLDTYHKKGCVLGGHPFRGIPGIEADTGSLGHGLGIGSGLALSAKLDNKDFITFVLLGDGELHEGSVWEAALFCAQHQLNNLVAIVDYNGVCSTDYLKDCIDVAPLKDKWQAFGWEVKEVNGHNYEDLLRAFYDVRQPKTEKPLMIIARTTKGKGVSFMENSPAWHHGIPTKEQYEQARNQLQKI